MDVVEEQITSLKQLWRNKRVVRGGRPATWPPGRVEPRRALDG